MNNVVGLYINDENGIQIWNGGIVNPHLAM
jgi:hypothetical protein